MTDDFHIGDAILFMKVGTHANEQLADIIARKRREIEEAGFSMWGYGGNTCHPTTMVQPFAAARTRPDRPIRLCMQPVNSRHFAEPIRAEEFSVDGVRWEPVPDEINVLGSRYALCVQNLHESSSKLALGDARVALGNSRGRMGDAYVKGHVDKACLEIVTEQQPSQTVDIGLVADLVSPFAVFLRN